MTTNIKIMSQIYIIKHHLTTNYFRKRWSIIPPLVLGTAQITLQGIRAKKIGSLTLQGAKLFGEGLKKGDGTSTAQILKRRVGAQRLRYGRNSLGSNGVACTMNVEAVHSWLPYAQSKIPGVDVVVLGVQVG